MWLVVALPRHSSNRRGHGGGGRAEYRCRWRQILAGGIGAGQPLAEVRTTVGQKSMQLVTHESGEPVTAGVSGFAQELAKPGVVLVNHTGPLEQPLARQRLPQPQGSPFAHLLRDGARNDVSANERRLP